MLRTYNPVFIIQIIRDVYMNETPFHTITNSMQALRLLLCFLQTMYKQLIFFLFVFNTEHEYRLTVPIHFIWLLIYITCLWQCCCCFSLFAYCRYPFHRSLLPAIRLMKTASSIVPNSMNAIRLSIHQIIDYHPPRCSFIRTDFTWPYCEKYSIKSFFFVFLLRLPTCKQDDGLQKPG